jgi:hypothetical protein
VIMRGMPARCLRAARRRLADNAAWDAHRGARRGFITSSCSCHAGAFYVTAPVEDTGSRKSTRAWMGAQLMSNAL